MMDFFPDKSEQTQMNDVREYLEEIYDRFSNEDLHEQFWKRQESEDEYLSEEEALFDDFVYDVFIENKVMTPQDFKKIVEFVRNPDLRIMYVDFHFGPDAVVVDFLRSILPPNIEIYSRFTLLKDLRELESDETFICASGDKYALEELFLLDSFPLRKYADGEQRQRPTRGVDRVESEDGTVGYREYIVWQTVH